MCTLSLNLPHIFLSDSLPAKSLYRSLLLAEQTLPYVSQCVIEDSSVLWLAWDIRENSFFISTNTQDLNSGLPAKRIQSSRRLAVPFLMLPWVVRHVSITTTPIAPLLDVVWAVNTLAHAILSWLSGPLFKSPPLVNRIFELMLNLSLPTLHKTRDGDLGALEDESDVLKAKE